MKEPYENWTERLLEKEKVLTQENWTLRLARAWIRFWSGLAICTLAIAMAISVAGVLIAPWFVRFGGSWQWGLGIDGFTAFVLSIALANERIRQR